MIILTHAALYRALQMAIQAEDTACQVNQQYGVTERYRINSPPCVSITEK